MDATAKHSWARIPNRAPALRICRKCGMTEERTGRLTYVYRWTFRTAIKRGPCLNVWPKGWMEEQARQFGVTPKRLTIRARNVEADRLRQALEAVLASEWIWEARAVAKKALEGAE